MSNVDLQEVKEEVRARSDIVDVVGLYVQLKRSGKSWRGLCPFHSDRNPSFSVSPATQSYRCWSCGEKGDVFQFIEKRESLDFVEALEFLARRAGIAIDRSPGAAQKAGLREKMLAANIAAAKFYQDRLLRSTDAQKYLADRAVLKSTQDLFQIGFAPDDMGALCFHLERNGHDLAAATAAGLVRMRPEGGGHYDIFRDRLMFPILDVSGRVIGFGGRAMGDHPAKYLNTEATPLFDKSRTLYGLSFARRQLGPQRPAVLVEGYMDVVTMHQAGFTQCVATLGTALTIEHARALSRYNPLLIVCYDADEAGIKAAQRSAEVWDALDLAEGEVRVARLPRGEDPDSLLRSGAIATMQQALDGAISAIDFQLERIFERNDRSTPEGRFSALQECMPILATVRSRMRRSSIATQLAVLHPRSAQNLNMAIEEILADADAEERRLKRNTRGTVTEMNGRPLAEEPTAWKGARRTATGPQAAEQPTAQPTPPRALTGDEKAERQILRALFQAEWRSDLLARVSPEILITPQARELFDLIARTPAGPDGGIDPLTILQALELASSKTDAKPPPDGLPTEEIVRQMWEESSALSANEPLTRPAIDDCVRRLERARENQIRRELAAGLRDLDSVPPGHRESVYLYHEKMREMRGSQPMEAD